MRVIIERDSEAMAVRAAQVVAELVRRKPNAVLGLATGSTPIGLYQQLIRLHQKEQLDFSKVTSFNLDEYWRIENDHPQSYHSFMNEHLFRFGEQDGGINLPEAQTHLPDGECFDPLEECERYERDIRDAGGIDLQVLGIGRDGHIAFNEPGTSLASRTSVVALHPQTIEDNARFFDSPEQVPRKALTMGVGTILESSVCVILAHGRQKADIWARMIEGPVTSQVTASALQLHPWTIAICDEEAAASLQHRDHYRHREAELADISLLPPRLFLVESAADEKTPSATREG